MTFQLPSEKMCCKIGIFHTASKKAVILFCILTLQFSSTTLAPFNKYCNCERLWGPGFGSGPSSTPQGVCSFSPSAHCAYFLQGSSTFCNHSSLLGFRIDHREHSEAHARLMLNLHSSCGLIPPALPFSAITFYSLPTNIFCMYVSPFLFLRVCM